MTPHLAQVQKIAYGFLKGRPIFSKIKVIDSKPGSVTCLFTVEKELLNKEVPMSQIKEFLERQQVNQLHKDSRQIPAFNPIVVYRLVWHIKKLTFQHLHLFFTRSR